MEGILNELNDVILFLNHVNSGLKLTNKTLDNDLLIKFKNRLKSNYLYTMSIENICNIQIEL